MNLCTCNNCDNIWKDMNPQVNAKEYPNNLNYEPLTKLYDDKSDLSSGYWVCPKCCTDNYLSDIVTF